jgi:hypothetical protein
MREMELESFVVTQQQQHQVAATEKPHHQPGTTLGEPITMEASAMMALVLVLAATLGGAGAGPLRWGHASRTGGVVVLQISSTTPGSLILVLR